MARRLGIVCLPNKSLGGGILPGPASAKGPGPGFHSGAETKSLTFLDSYWKTYSQEQSLVRRLDSCVYRTNHWGVASCRGPPAPKGQGLGFTMARKQKAWHSWIHIGKRIAWNNLWSGALDSCVYRTNHWGVASCRGPPAPKGQGLGFTVARKQKA